MKLSNKAIGIGIAVLAIALVVIAIYLGLQKKPTTESGAENETQTTTIEVRLPDENKTESSSITGTTSAQKAGLNVNVNGNPQNINKRIPAEEAAKPINPVTPTQVINTTRARTQPPITSYKCNAPNHHCINAENHAYITNLEIQRCAYCGSHSCPSFYYVSSAGIPMCNPSLCPQYNVKKDPIKYCQTCGRPNGDGNNGTCQKYIVDTICPICGELIKAHECHTHS